MKYLEDLCKFLGHESVPSDRVYLAIERLMWSILKVILSAGTAKFLRIDCHLTI